MITRILTAKEAAAMTRETLEEELMAQIERISTAISRAASNGKYEIDLHEYLDTPIREYLQNQGYTLRDWREYNDEYVTINWRNS